MARVEVTATATTTASPAQVFTVLADRPTWPDWSSLGRYEAVSGVEGEIGSVCRFVTGPIKSVERLVELTPGQGLAYELVSGLPMRDYRGVVRLTPTAAGTTIDWSSSFEPTIPGTGWFFRTMMNKVLGDMSKALAARAEI